MVSEAYRQLEHKVGAAAILQDELLEAIAYKLKKEKAVIEHLIFRTCVTVDAAPFAIAHVVNEFLIHLHELDVKEE